MLKSSQNKINFFLALLVAGFVQTAQGAGPITNLTLLGFSNSPTFTAGVTTNTPTTTLFINTFASGNTTPDAGEVVQLQLVDNGTVVENGISPTSFMTTGSGILNGGNSSLPITFFRSGSAITLRAICAAETENSEIFTVNVSSAKKLVVLGPGMTHVPGTNPSLTTGIRGSFSPQTPNQAFTVTVILTDNQFNKVSAADNLSFTSGSLVNLPSPGVLTGGSGDFTITISGAQITRTLTVDDTTNSAVSDGTLDITTAGPPTKEVFPFPSPFDPYQRDITFRFRLDEAKSVKLRVLNLMGQEVWGNEVSASAGFTDVTWNGRNDRGTVVAAGVYYITLEVDGAIESKKRFGVIK